MNAADRSYLCGLCDRYHVAGNCPDGAPAPVLTICPRCDAEGRGKGLLVKGINTETGREYYACAEPRCRYGQTVAKKRTRGRRGRGRVKR